MERDDVVAEKQRLRNQCERILDRLRQGMVSNHELAEIALKYSSRISELRKQGWTIRVCARDWKSGICFYELLGMKEERQNRLRNEQKKEIAKDVHRSRTTGSQQRSLF